MSYFIRYASDGSENNDMSNAETLYGNDETRLWNFSPGNLITIYIALNR